MSTKKILVAGRLAPEGIARLEAEGFQVDVASESDLAGLARLVPGHHGLVAGPSVGVPSEVIRAADVLEVDAPDAGAFISIETPADYARYIGRLPEIPTKP